MGDTCISCGAVIPEGRHICANCASVDNEKTNSYWWEKPLKVCPICGKGFSPSPLHYWKIGNGGIYSTRTISVCSYTCMRTWEKLQLFEEGKNSKSGAKGGYK